MGLFTKSLFILLVAVSTPLLYRQFANDNTVKFMSSYYSNYRMIDQFLRLSANHLDQAKDYVNSEQLKQAYGKFNEQINNLIEITKVKLQQQQSKPELQDQQTKEKRSDSDGKSRQQEKTKSKERKAFKICSCPGEDYQGQEVRLWNKQELVKYDGNSEQGQVYLAFLGLVYDVSANKQHYASGAEYNAFTGKDATRAFVTGNFTHDLNDNLNGLDESYYTHIEQWASFYNTNYPVLGRIEGAFYDSLGCATSELVRVYQVFETLNQAKADKKDSSSKFPECNSEWNSDTKQGKVWCTVKSGGVERDWVGVPRIYNDGENQRCACFNLDDPSSKDDEKFMSLYPNCQYKATECMVAHS